jgi:hypothetical protein
VIIFCLPFSPAGVFFKHGFSWSAVNYAPLITIGVMVAVTIWYLVSARHYFKGPIRTIDMPEVGAISPEPPDMGPVITTAG